MNWRGKMNLCGAYPVFIILSIASGGAIAYFSNVPVLYGISIGMAVSQIARCSDAGSVNPGTTSLFGKKNYL
jgi:hypothetical protein